MDHHRRLGGDGGAGHRRGQAVGLPFRLRRVRTTGRDALSSGPAATLLPPARLLRSVAANEKLKRPGRVSSSPSAGAACPSRSPSSGCPSRTPSRCTSKTRRSRPGCSISSPRRSMTASRPPNVVTTFGAVHSVTPSGLAEAGKRFAPRIEALPHPRIAVLLGGESQAFSFPPETAASFGAKLARLARETQGLAARHAFAAHSRRLARRLDRRHQGRAALRVGRRRREPLFRLSRASPTPSSSPRTRSTWSPRPRAPANRSMCSRCPADPRRLSRFHRLMQERGATRPFEGRLEVWSYAPINDTEMVASAIRRALGLETKG